MYCSPLFCKSLFSFHYVLQLVVEASSAAGVAAVMSERMREMDPRLRKIGVILCGGNVDLNKLPWS